MTDTGPARLPGIPKLQTNDVALARWAQAVAEHLEVRAGARGNPQERAVTQRELTAFQAQLGLVPQSRSSLVLPRQSSQGDVPVALPGGGVGWISADKFASAIQSSSLYQSLVSRIGSPGSYANVPEAIRTLLEQSIAEEAHRRGADITRVENKLQTTTESLAFTVEEVTAAIERSAAGVREAAYAAANTSKASAGKIITIEARLNDVGGVTIEEAMTATADRVAGLAGEYSVKINAGKAVAGFGLAASEDPSGATESAFIIQADRFALTTPYSFVQEATPSATAIGDTWYKPSTGISYRATATGAGSWTVYTPLVPFGVDTTTGQTFINGSLRINTGGPALTDQAKMVRITADSAIFKADAANVIQTPNAVRIEAVKHNTSANVTWSTSPAVTLYTAASGGSVVTQGSAVATSVVYLRKADYGSNTNVTVTMVCDGFTDSLSILRTVDGVDSPVVVLGNPSHPLPSDSAGTVSTYSGSGSTIQVYVAGVARTVTSVTATGTSITAGAVSGTGTTTATVADSSSITADTAKVSYTIGYTKADGTAGTAYATQAVYKQKAGASGTDGTNGSRGTVTTYASGSSWSDATANSSIATFTGSATKVVGDTVTISNGTTFAETKYWGGSSWLSPGVVIDGNLLVTGTLSASKIYGGRLSGAAIGIGSGVTPGGYKFEVSGAGVCWSAGLVTYGLLPSATNAHGALIAVDSSYDGVRSSAISGSSGNAVTAMTLSGSSGTALYASAAGTGYALDAAGPARVSKTIQVTGVAAPSSGAGVEILYSAPAGFVQAYDRGTSAYKTMYISGSTVILNGPTASSAILDTSGFKIDKGFGCNGKSAQTAYSVNAASTDLATVIALCNQLRAALIANGVAV